MRRVVASERGQASPEWIAMVLLVAAGFAAVLAVVSAIGGTGLAAAIARSMVCAAGIGSCDPADPLELTYGDELAALVRDHAPQIRYEDGMHAVPVDFRDCRQDACANAPDDGDVARSYGGDPVTLFTHVVDCRGSAPDPADDCAGERAGNVYMQYWAYYPGSQSLHALRGVGNPGFHNDDWEGYQTRISPQGADARASSHHGYNYDGGPLNWASDAGIASRAAWGADQGTYYVSGGSHAGHAHEDDSGHGVRWTDPAQIDLVPVETLEGSDYRFAISAPWLKEVYRDPESEGTG